MVNNYLKANTLANLKMSFIDNNNYRCTYRGGNTPGGTRPLAETPCESKPKTTENYDTYKYCGKWEIKETKPFPKTTIYDGKCIPEYLCRQTGTIESDGITFSTTCEHAVTLATSASAVMIVAALTTMWNGWPQAFDLLYSLPNWPVLYANAVPQLTQGPVSLATLAICLKLYINLNKLLRYLNFLKQTHYLFFISFWCFPSFLLGS